MEVLLSYTELKVLSCFSKWGVQKRTVSEMENKRIKKIEVFIFVCYREELGLVMLVRLIVILILYLNYVVWLQTSKYYKCMVEKIKSLQVQVKGLKHWKCPQ